MYSVTRASGEYMDDVHDPELSSPKIDIYVSHSDAFCLRRLEKSIEEREIE
jgi:hypothetical protein